MPGELVTRKQARWMLDHLVTAAVRYGHDMAIVLAALPGESTPEDMELAERRLTDALRDADIITRWASRELLMLLPDTDRGGVALAAERLRAAAGDLPLSLGTAHWAGDTADDLLARAERALAADRSRD